MQSSESEVTTLKAKPKEYYNINGRIEQMQSFFEQICQSFANRKQSISHIINKAETVLQFATSSQQLGHLQGLVRELETDVSGKLTHANKDIDRTTAILSGFVRNQITLIEQTCKQEANAEKKIAEKLIQNSTRRVQELRALIAKDQQTSAQNIDIFLKENSSKLERQVKGIKGNTAQAKKQANINLKQMLSILSEIEAECADRESGEQNLLAHIDSMHEE